MMEENTIPTEDTAIAEPTIEETMESTFAAIQEREGTEEGAEPVEKPAPATRPRDETGKFAKAEQAPAEKAAPEAAPVDKNAKPAFEDKGPPGTWRAQAKAQWGTLPPALKEEVYKREQDAMTGINQYSAKAQLADGFMGIISPYQSIIAATGADIPTALNEVLKTAAIFHIGTAEQKAATLRAMAQRHGVDLGQLTAHSGNDQFRDPALEKLERELADMRGQLANQRQASQNSEWQAANGEIAAFQSDPSHKYFSDVRDEMGRLMAAGLASTLSEAYEKACSLNPSVRSALNLEAQQEATRKAAEERATRAAAARRAGQFSTRSVPAPRPTTEGTAKSWQEGLEETAREIFSRDAA